MGRSAGPGSTKSRSLRRRIFWLPPFLVALAGAAAGEMAVGLLLYSAEGFLRALTVVLVAEMAALGVGFLASTRMPPTDVDGLRRRWLLTVFSFAAAAVFAGFWGLSDGWSGSRLHQGLGLGLLVALPLFSTGAVLGALAAVRGGLASGVGETDCRVGVATPSFFGAGAGLLFTGLYGVPTLQPASLYLFCVVIVSGGALLHGWITDRRMRILPLEDPDRGPGSEEGSRIRWERRVRTTPRGEIHVLYVDGRVADAGAVPRGTSEGRAAQTRGSGEEAGGATGRRDEGERGDDEGTERSRLRTCLPWQRHVLDVVRDGVRPGGEKDLRILMVGTGTGALLADLAAGRHGDIIVLDTTGGSPSAFAGVGHAGDDVPGPEVSVVSDWDALSASTPTDGFDVVIVHLRLIPRDGPFRSIDLDALERVLTTRGREGIVLLGGVDVTAGTAVEPTVEWLSSRCGAPASLFRPRAGTWGWETEAWDDLLASLGDLGGALVACRSAQRTKKPNERGELDEPEGPVTEAQEVQEGSEEDRPT